MNIKNLGQRLQDIRNDRDKSQKEIAEILQIPTSAYGKYERGINMMGVDKYIKLAKYYELSLDYLLGIITYPKPISRSETEKLEIKKIYEGYNNATKDIKQVIDILLKLR